MARFFIPMRRILNAIINIDVDQLALEITRTNEFQVLVIQLNTEGQKTSQLFVKGEDARGITLESIGGGYSPFTIEEKRRKGQPIDRVTLKDSGDFYLSFKVIPYKGGFQIEANPIKVDETGTQTDLTKEWGEDIIGLNSENLNIIVDFYKNAILEKVKEKIQAA